MTETLTPIRSGRRKRSTCCRSTGARRSCWCAARARACGTPTARSYLDFTSGVGVAALGHANPGLAAVIAEQARVLVHTSNLFFHPFQAQLAEKLCRLSGLDRAFFCNSGTEAVEACLKFARRYWFTRGETSRTQVRRAVARVSRSHVRLAVDHGRPALPRAVRSAGRRA